MKEGSATITVIIHACEEGGFTAECLEILGCFSEGETQEEVERNIRNAANECLSVLFEDCLNRLRSGVDFGCLSENFCSSLPIEYQLKYGTACGYVNFLEQVFPQPEFVKKASKS